MSKILKRMGIDCASEVIDLRNEISKVINNGDGTFKSIQFGYPIHHNNTPDGSWDEIDHEIYPNPNVEIDGYDFHTLHNYFKLGFKKDITQNNFMTWNHGDENCCNIYITIDGIALYDASLNQYIKIMSPNICEGSVNNDYIKYTEVFDGIDVTYSSQAEKVKEIIDIKENIQYWIEDPLVYGYNPETTYVCFLYKITHENTNIVETEEGDIAFTSSVHEHEELIFMENAWGKTYNDMDINCITNLYDSETLLIGLSYETIIYGAYPMFIDPTMTTSKNYSATNFSYYVSKTYNKNYTNGLPENQTSAVGGSNGGTFQIGRTYTHTGIV